MGFLGYLLLLVLALSLLANVVFVFRFVWRGRSRTRTLAVNGATVLFTFLAIFLAVELYFRTSFNASGAFAFTKASRAWFDEYWRPVNSLGYRDDDYSPEALEAKRTVVVLGDSIAAGHGIDDYRERFSEQLERRLGEGWLVATVAQCGWNTSQELEALKSFPVKPEAVVLSYCVNDLDAAATEGGFPRPPVPRPGRVMAALTERFYSIDFLYWQFVRGAEITETMWRYYDACYATESIWQRHRGELKALVEYTRAAGIELVVVVFPLLTDVARTAAHNERVIALFEGEDVSVIDLTGIVRDAAPGAYVANAFDGHPNAALHAIVAERLEAVLREELADGA